MNPTTRNIALTIVAVLALGIAGWVIFGRGGGSSSASGITGPTIRKTFASADQTAKKPTATKGTPRAESTRKTTEKKEFRRGEQKTSIKKDKRGGRRKTTKEKTEPIA